MDKHTPAVSRHSVSVDENPHRPPCHAKAKAAADHQSLGYTVLTIWECEIKTILTTHTIPNLPPKHETTPAPSWQQMMEKPNS